MWVYDQGYDPTDGPTADVPITGFRPKLNYRYDADLRRVVRARIVATGQEVIAWVAPTGAPPGVPLLSPGHR